MECPELFFVTPTSYFSCRQNKGISPSLEILIFELLIWLKTNTKLV